MSTLAQVSTEHLDRLMAHVDLLPHLVDEVGRAPWSELRADLAGEHAFYVATLLPHMESVEAGIHRELDRLLTCRLATEPIEREHEQVRSLVGRLGGIAAEATLSAGRELELCRVIVTLYAVLKAHLLEESRYVPILERNLEPSELDALAASMGHAARAER
jgi:hypothetical protein